MTSLRDIGATEVLLPNGFWLDDQCQRVAGLRPLSGYDEANLLALRGGVSPARWTSELLSRCVIHIGIVRPVSMDMVQSLTVGDREALLLHLRRLTFGDILTCILHCPKCNEKLSIDLKISQLLLPPTPSPAFWFKSKLNQSRIDVTFRLPTGADQEAIADIATHDQSAAVDLLVEACLHKITDGEKLLESLPESGIEDLSALIAERDPQAELILNSDCPECEHHFEVLFDVGSYFAEEIDHRLPYLYREVHLMAWHYHWSESDILNMSRPHRQIYLDLLDETLREAVL